MDARSVFNGIETFLRAVDQANVDGAYQAAIGILQQNKRPQHDVDQTRESIRAALATAYARRERLGGPSALIFDSLAKGTIDGVAVKAVREAYLRGTGEPGTAAKLLERQLDSIRALQESLTHTAKLLRPIVGARPSQPEDRQLITLYFGGNLHVRTLTDLGKAVGDWQFVIRIAAQLGGFPATDPDVSEVRSGSLELELSIGLGVAGVLVGIYRSSVALFEFLMKRRLVRAQTLDLSLDAIKTLTEIFEKDQTHVRVATELTAELMEQHGALGRDGAEELRTSVLRAVEKVAAFQDGGGRLLLESPASEDAEQLAHITLEANRKLGELARGRTVLQLPAGIADAEPPETTE